LPIDFHHQEEVTPVFTGMGDPRIRQFLLHYVRRRLASHLVVIASVLAAVACAVGSQYGVKNLVDVLGSNGAGSGELWSAVALLLALVAGDNPEAMGVRRQTVEHPFGTLKAWMGATHFLTRTLDKVRTEMSLHVLAYNLKRTITILGVGPLIAAIRT
jgi:hypothetical protein